MRAELSTLCDCLENDASHPIEDRHAIAAELRGLLAHYREEQQRAGASLLVGVSRRLQARLKAD